jgi:hypothetical protein
MEETRREKPRKLFKSGHCRSRHRLFSELLVCDRRYPALAISVRGACAGESLMSASSSENNGGHNSQELGVPLAWPWNGKLPAEHPWRGAPAGTGATATRVGVFSSNIFKLLLVSAILIIGGLTWRLGGQLEKVSTATLTQAKGDGSPPAVGPSTASNLGQTENVPIPTFAQIQAGGWPAAVDQLGSSNLGQAEKVLTPVFLRMQTGWLPAVEPNQVASPTKTPQMNKVADKKQESPARTISRAARPRPSRVTE